MLKIGCRQQLKVRQISHQGLILESDSEMDLLLLDNNTPKPCAPGDLIEVFVYSDSSGHPQVTRQFPKAQVGEFALLTVVASESIGAFLDWGLSQDLFLPLSEQTEDLYEGKEIIVFLFLDKKNRITASMRLEEHLSPSVPEYQEEQRVNLLIYRKTDLGYKALINGQHHGVLYHNEVFQSLHYGQVLPGYIKKIREDGKIDLSLTKTGHRGAEEIGPRILELLAQEKGFIAINDKTPAEKIYELFGVSKKKFKIALGGLYKKRLITVSEDGIHLVR